MRAGPDRVVLSKGGERRLICVPFAGGSARSFTRLARHIGEEWTVTAVQPPVGFGNGEPTVDSLAHFYLGLLAADLQGPGLVLGHSMGAAVVHRMARIRGEHWPRGLRVVLSAPPDPGHSSSPLLALTDRELLDEARKSGMVPDLQVSEDLALRMLLPAFKQDLEVMRQGWRPEPVAAGVDLLGGSQDQVFPPAALTALAELIGADSSRVVDGGHLYVLEEPAASAAALREIDAAAREQPLTPR